MPHLVADWIYLASLASRSLLMIQWLGVDLPSLYSIKSGVNSFVYRHVITIENEANCFHLMLFRYFKSPVC